MDEARRTAKAKLGNEKEHQVFIETGFNMDEYIERVCNVLHPHQPAGGKCPHCHKHTVTVNLVQTRSGDEGMTAIAACESCERTWTAN